MNPEPTVFLIVRYSIRFKETERFYGKRREMKVVAPTEFESVFAA